LKSDKNYFRHQFTKAPNCTKLFAEAFGVIWWIGDLVAIKRFQILNLNY